MRFPTMLYVRPAKPQLTEHYLEFLNLKGGLSESTLVKMPHSWKSHVTAHIRNKWLGIVLPLEFPRLL